MASPVIIPNNDPDAYVIEDQSGNKWLHFDTQTPYTMTLAPPSGLDVDTTIGGTTGACHLKLRTGTTGALTLTGGDDSIWQITNGSLEIKTVGEPLTIRTESGATLNVTSAGALNLTSAGAGVWAAGGLLTIDSSGGAIKIGGNANPYDIEIGRGAAARRIKIGNDAGITDFTLEAGTGAVLLAANATEHNTTVGSTTLGSALTLQGGTGGIQMSAQGASTWNVAGGALNIQTSQAALNIKTQLSGTLTVDSAGSLNLKSVAGDWQASGPLTIDTTSASGITIGGDANVQAITIGNETGATAVTVKAGTGSVTIGTNGTQHYTALGSTTLASSTAVKAGTGNLDIEGGGAVNVNGAGILSLIGGAGPSRLEVTGALLVRTLGGGALTLTSAAAATWSTTAGALTLNGTGGINLRNAGTDALTITTGGAISMPGTAATALTVTNGVRAGSLGVGGAIGGAGMIKMATDTTPAATGEVGMSSAGRPRGYVGSAVVDCQMFGDPVLDLTAYNPALTDAQDPTAPASGHAQLYFRTRGSDLAEPRILGVDGIAYFLAQHPSWHLSELWPGTRTTPGTAQTGSGIFDAAESVLGTGGSTAPLIDAQGMYQKRNLTVINIDAYVHSRTPLAILSGRPYAIFKFRVDRETNVRFFFGYCTSLTDELEFDDPTGSVEALGLQFTGGETTNMRFVRKVAGTSQVAESSGVNFDPAAVYFLEIDYQASDSCFLRVLNEQFKPIGTPAHFTSGMPTASLYVVLGMRNLVSAPISFYQYVARIWTRGSE